MSLINGSSIRGKLILLFTTTASFTVLIACCCLWFFQLAYDRSTLQKEEFAAAQLIADTSGPAMLFADSFAASETLSSLTTDTRIRAACLFDRGDKLVARLAAGSSIERCPEGRMARSSFNQSRLTIVRSIVVKGEVVGSLYLEVGLSEMYSSLRRVALAEGLVLLFSTIFALCLSFFLERLISRPILHLTSVATQVACGGSLLMRAKRASNDELGVLIDQFNIMMDHLQQRQADLESARDCLEEKVSERTKDLSTEIAERKIIEHDLGVAKVLAEESNHAKSSFLANMSHELRTPLNAIIGYSEMLHEDAIDSGIVTMPGDLHKILNCAHHLLSLISDILDFSKIEAGEMKLYCEPVSTADILAEVMSTAEILARTNANTFALTTPIWQGMMAVDALRFRQCMLNLIGNACKFTQGGSISIAVERYVDERGAWVLWGVTDTGAGISLVEQGRLFQTFSQGDSSLTRKHGGSGLGLAISQQLCNAMGGYIAVDSLLGVGSTFTIWMPDVVEILSIEVAA